MKINIKLVLSLGVLFCQLGCYSTKYEKDTLAIISVQSGDFERFDTPLSISLDGITNVNESNLRLYELIRKELVPVAVQIGVGEKRFMHWILNGKTEPGKTRKFALRSEQISTKKNNIRIEREQDAYVFSSAEKPVIQYNSGIELPPEGVDLVYRRSGFLHPLYAPNGAVLTTIQPMDHPHHYGIWNPWTKTIFKGEEISFWDLQQGLGTVQFAGLGSLNQGPVFGSIQILHEHIAWPDSPREAIAINELKEVKVFNRTDGNFLIEVKIRLSPVDELILEEYRYGGFTLRATDYWTNENSYFFTSEGLDRDHADGQRAKWCVVFGDTPKGQAGILMMGHPANYNHPEPLRIWSSNFGMGRGDHFINFCPTRNKQWILEPGNIYMLRYRIFVFEGEIDKVEAERIWNDFSNPPTITWNK